jgi:putative membrane-bound dehydrogenase-like protein
MKFLRLCATALFLLPTLPAGAAEAPANAKAAPTPGGELVATEWAGDTLLGSPVALTLDNQGRVYVTQTTRRKQSELDIRAHADWVTKTLSFESVDERRKFYEEEMTPARSAANRKWLPDRNRDGVSDLRDLGVESELVLRIEDRAGSGKADTRTVFADGLNSTMTGVAAGVLWFDGNVYLTAIPSVWKFSDARTPGAVDAKREEWVTGFGVKVAYSGHDMHGLTVGPDGRIYWSIGDKGLNVARPDGSRVKAASEGAVLRCEPDGTGFEIFARGLRNPQELAFDEWGNLFSVDNDGDFRGERERFVYITEQSDSGWRCNWQYRKGDYNPWMAEKLAVPAWKGQAAYLTPPLANYSDGPCGFTYNPGTALGTKYRQHFFLTHFPGRKITAFRTEPVGAAFKMVEERRVFGGPMMTGLAWGPDGALFVADWNHAVWNPHNKGKIWKLDVAEPDPLRAETQALLRDGMAKRDAAALGGLLGHADQRVRLGAQFELVKRGDSAALLAAAKSGKSPLARVHGIWGVGQLARKKPAAAAPLAALLADADAEVRAQTAKVLGDASFKTAAQGIAKLLADDSARVRFHAALALAKVGAPSEVAAIVALLEKNDGADVFLRHAGFSALAGVCAADAQPLTALAASPNEEVRLAAVVALRRLAHAGAAQFLADTSPRVVAEAARAIHDDYSIPTALPALAALLERAPGNDPVAVRRAISANLRTGGSAGAKRLAAFAANGQQDTALRAEALATLGTWLNPSPLDRVEGRYRPLEPGTQSALFAALDEFSAAYLGDASPEIRAAACELARLVLYPKAGPQLAKLANDAAQDAKVRRAALAALAAVKGPGLGDAAKAALDSVDAGLRTEALGILASVGGAGADALPLLAKALEGKNVREQQSVLAILGGMKAPAAADIITKWMERLAAGQVPPALQLDVLEAARTAGTPALTAMLTAFAEKKPAADALAPFREALSGGDALRGKALAMEHLAAQCTQCHKIGEEGAEVGPDLAKVASRLPREKLLEALVAPNATITPGFGVIVVTQKDGRSVSGMIANESDTALVIRAPDGVETKVEKSAIAERTPPVSMMPPMGALLNPRELRDVVEYLATLK